MNKLHSSRSGKSSNKANSLLTDRSFQDSKNDTQRLHHKYKSKPAVNTRYQKMIDEFNSKPTENNEKAVLFDLKNSVKLQTQRFTIND